MSRKSSSKKCIYTQQHAVSYMLVLQNLFSWTTSLLLLKEKFKIVYFPKNTVGWDRRCNSKKYCNSYGKGVQKWDTQAVKHATGYNCLMWSVASGHSFLSMFERLQLQVNVFTKEVLVLKDKKCLKPKFFNF